MESARVRELPRAQELALHHRARALRLNRVRSTNSLASVRNRTRSIDPRTRRQCCEAVEERGGSDADQDQTIPFEEDPIAEFEHCRSRFDFAARPRSGTKKRRN